MLPFIVFGSADAGKIVFAESRGFKASLSYSNHGIFISSVG
jgi:hypothetical protein